VEYETVEEPLSDLEIEFNEQIQSLELKTASIFVRLHKAAIETASQYLVNKQRHVYITPTKFIELFKLFTQIMNRKHSHLDSEREKYLVGIQKLDEANVIVDQMKEQLEEFKPILEEKTKQTEETLVKLDAETKEVDKVKVVVEQESAIVAQQKEAASAIKEECESRLAEAMPLFEEAIRALKTINTKDFVTMKSYNSPPYLIKLALEATCIMLGVAPNWEEKQVGKNKVKVPNYWEKSKKLLNDYKGFIGKLEKYDKDNIPQDRITKIQDYLNNPKFTPAEIRNASEAAEGICKWVIAICKYDIIAKEIRPKREALNEASAKLEVVTKQLMEKQAELQTLIDKKNVLEEEFKNQNFEKQNLISQIDECQAKLTRAGILMGSLGNERSRWEKTAEKLLKEKQNLLGDMIVATCFVTYMGPFEGSYRESLLQTEWIPALQNEKIMVSDKFALKDAIGVLRQIQQWQLKGLPQDSVSIENMIIMEETSDKWPLIIDPQGQALKFLKDLLPQFEAMKMSNYQRKLEATVVGGQAVIMENVDQRVDPAL